MSNLFDRMREELDTLGDRVQGALKSSQLHLERSSLVALRGKAYFRLGSLVYKKERGGEVNPAELDAAFAQLDDIAGKIAAIDRELSATDSVTVDEKPAPPAEPGEAEIQPPPAPPPT